MDVSLIKKAAIFADLNESELAKVLEICSEQHFKFGQTIFKEAEPGNRLYIISCINCINPLKTIGFNRSF